MWKTQTRISAITMSDGTVSYGSSICEDSEPFTESGLRTLKGFTIFSAVLSCLGSTFIIATWWLQRGVRRTLGLHIICSLSVADFFSSLVFIMDGLSPTGELSVCRKNITSPDPNAGAACGIFAASSQLFGLAAVLWTGALALALHLGVLRGAKIATQEPHTLLRRMHIGVWSASFFSLFVCAAAGTLGPTGQWCWVKLEDWWAGLTFYYLPLLGVFGYSLTIYWRTRRTLLSIHREASSAGGDVGRTSAVLGVTSRLRAFLLVYAVIHSFQLLNRVWDVLAPHHPSYALSLFHAILGPLQGMCNAIVYGWSASTRRVWSSAFPGLCGCVAPRDTRPATFRAQSSGSGELAPDGGLAGDAHDPQSHL